MVTDSEYYNWIEDYISEDENISIPSVLKKILVKFQAKEGSVYFLSMNKGTFELVYSTNKIFSNSSLSQKIVNHFINVENPVEYKCTENNIYYLPIIRNGWCVGIIKLFDFLSEDSEAKLHEYAKFLVITRDRMFLKDLLENSQKPIEYNHVTKEVFYKEIIKLIKNSTKMKYIILRELDRDGTLYCLGNSGFQEYEGDEDDDLFSFKIDEIPSSFLELIETKKTKTITDTTDLTWVTKNKHFTQVKSAMLIPIIVGSELFGVLTLGTSVKYKYSLMEQFAFESITNAIGVSINNFRNFNQYITYAQHLTKVQTSLTSSELAQTMRHAVSSDIELCRLDLWDLESEKDSLARDGLIELIDTRFSRITSLMQKIKKTTRPPEKELELCSIKSFWDSTVDIVKNKLNEQSITIHDDLGNVKVEIYKDWIMHAFLNLLNNSIDAFTEKKQKRGRKITLSLNKTNNDDNFIYLTYSDNATGINKRSLYIPDDLIEEKDKLNKIIFEPNVTSKRDKDGSGWGMYLTRLIIQSYHHGNIDLAKYTDGIVFNIKLKKKIDKHNKKGKK